MKTSPLRTHGVPLVATIGALYLWLEFGTTAPIWWPMIIALILVVHYAAYFKIQERYALNEEIENKFEKRELVID